MLKITTLGLGVWLAIASISTSMTPIAAAKVPPAPWVTDICPGMWWTEGFRIGETVPLDPHQYHQAVVTTETPLRAGYGFEGPVITRLTAGAQVTVMGEVWDMGCNQWMVIPSDGGAAYIHGNALQNL